MKGRKKCLNFAPEYSQKSFTVPVVWVDVTWDPYVIGPAWVKPWLEDPCSREGQKKVTPVSSQRSYSHSHRLVLSAQERKFNAHASSTWSESAWQRINASSRPIGQIERERESRRLFHGTIQLERMALITSLEIPRMFGDDRLGCEASFLKILNQIWGIFNNARPSHLNFDSGLLDKDCLFTFIIFHGQYLIDRHMPWLKVLRFWAI